VFRIAASINKGFVRVGVIERCGEASSMMRQESTQVSGLSPRIESLMTHFDEVRENSKPHMRPNEYNQL
jgi:hypothetical protein